MSTFEIILLVSAAILIALVSRLLQQNKLMRVYIIQLEQKQGWPESDESLHQAEETSSLIETDDTPTDDAEAELVHKARTACQMAEMSIHDLSDEYEHERFEKFVSKAVSAALAISDPFYRSAALHPLVVLLAKAGKTQRASDLLESIQDRFVQAQVEHELAEIGAAT